MGPDEYGSHLLDECCGLIATQKGDMNMNYDSNLGFLGMLEEIERPDPNVAVEIVSEQFRPVLDDFCESVPFMVNDLWSQRNHKPYSFEDLSRDMQNKTQKFLYDANISMIKSDLQDTLLELTADYLMEIRSAIPKLTFDLSDDAERKINNVLSYESTKLHFKDVGVPKFCRISVNTPYEDRIDVSLYSLAFIMNLKGNGKSRGAFERQCIVKLAMEYFAQIEDWADNLIYHIIDIADSDLNRL